MNAATRALLLVLVLTASTFAGVLPVGAGASPLTSPHLATGSLSSGAASLPAPVVPAVHVRPSVLGCNPNIPWPAWGDVGDGFPPTGNIALQSGCGGTLYAAQDEVHNSFLSPTAGSAQRFTESVHLPKNYTQYKAYMGFYLGAVVSGDSQSAWNQS